MMTKKQTLGRRKIEMKQIEDTNHRHMAFSKRRGGLFKKASELCILTGAEIAILVESPGGRLYSFGHPSVDAIIDRYHTGSGQSLHHDAIIDRYHTGSDQSLHHTGSCTPMQDQFNEEFAQISKELEDEKKKETMKGNNDTNNNGLFWWEGDFEHLGVEELGKYIAAMEELKEKVNKRADELKMIKSSGGLKKI